MKIKKIECLPAELGDVTFSFFDVSFGGYLKMHCT